MNYEYNESCSSAQAIHAHSMNIQDISYIRTLQKECKKKKKGYQNKKLSELQKHKGNFKFLEKYIHSCFVNLYMTDETDYNIKMIDDILGNESTHLVAEFKDYLIIGDDTEFLQKSYSMKESSKYLPKIYDYYKSCSVIFPNYVILPESKYIYKNIRRKQKVLDNQQEQDDKKEKIKKGDLQIEDNDEFFTSKTFYSILDQTNTSNVRLFFGVNENNQLDINETPNNIVAKLEQAENQAIKNKMNLMKQNNKNKYILERLLTNTFDLNNKKMSKEKEKEKEKKNANMNSINGNNHVVNRYIYIRNNSNNKNGVLCYMTKNSAKNRSNTNINQNTYFKNCAKTKLTPRVHIKSSSNVMENETNNINRNMNTSKSNKKYNMPNNIKYNNSNKYLQKFSVNPLFPNKKIISRICNNIGNNNNNSKVNTINVPNTKKNSLNYNSVNFLKKKKSPGCSVSPSSITIEANSFRRKMHININESNSTRNIINNKLLNSRDKIFINPKKNNSLKNGINYNNTQTHNSIHTTNTLPTERSDNSRIKNEKYILRKNNSNHNYKFNLINKNNFLNNNSNNNTYKPTYSNTYENNFNNIYQINSIPNMSNNKQNNIGNIGSNNSSKSEIKTKMNYRENSSGNVIDYSKPYVTNGKQRTIELETIKVTKRKKNIHPKMSLLSDSNNSNGDLIDTRKNTIGNNYFESIVFSSIHNEDSNGSRQRPINTINYVNKKQILFEDINKKKNMPIKKEIIINMNGFNGYNAGSLTSRNPNNIKSNKKNNGDMNYYNSENKIYANKTINNHKKGNFCTKNDTNPVKIKKFYDIKTSKNSYGGKVNGCLSKSRKK